MLTRASALWACDSRTEECDCVRAAWNNEVGATVTGDGDARNRDKR
jgi:hypothetical protein